MATPPRGFIDESDSDFWGRIIGQSVTNPSSTWHSFTVNEWTQKHRKMPRAWFRIGEGLWIPTSVERDQAHAAR